MQVWCKYSAIATNSKIKTKKIIRDINKKMLSGKEIAVSDFDGL